MTTTTNRQSYNIFAQSFIYAVFLDDADLLGLYLRQLFFISVDTGEILWSFQPLESFPLEDMARLNYMIDTAEDDLALYYYPEFDIYVALGKSSKLIFMSLYIDSVLVTVSNVDYRNNDKWIITTNEK